MAQNFLNPSIVNRKKRGFNVPFADWSRGPWKNFIQETMFAANAAHWDYMDKKAFAKLWNDHISCKRDRSRQIFSMLMLTLWWRESFNAN